MSLNFIFDVCLCNAGNDDGQAPPPLAAPLVASIADAVLANDVAVSAAMFLFFKNYMSILFF